MFREPKTLEDFDFTFNPSVKRKQIHDLATYRFVREARDVLLLGPPGIGKSYCLRNQQAGKKGRQEQWQPGSGLQLPSEMRYTEFKKCWPGLN